MTAKLIDGKKLAEQTRENLKQKISALSIKPELAVIMVGNNPASEIYVKSKEKACTEVGITAHTYHFPDTILEEELLALVDELNQNEHINGILVQLPLPKNFDEKKVLEHINPLKDVDGFHPLNTGLMVQKSGNTFLPCTPKGIIRLIKSTNENIDGMNAVVIGRSQIVGLPTAHLLLKENCTVTIAHSHTKNLAELCHSADILVAAIGKPEMFTKEYIKSGAIVIDVGINRTPEGLRGDVKRADAESIASYLTPVPGGVGPMTIAMLLENTYEAFLKQQHS